MKCGYKKNGVYFKYRVVVRPCGVYLLLSLLPPHHCRGLFTLDAHVCEHTRGEDTTICEQDMCIHACTHVIRCEVCVVLYMYSCTKYM